MIRSALLASLLFLIGPAAEAAGEERPERRSFSATDVCGLAGSQDGCQGLEALVRRARESVPQGEDPARTLALLNRFFFEEEGFRSGGPASWSSLLPEEVIARREGNCVGLAALYLIVAHDLHLPIHAVATPRHVFVRWDDERFRRNIELLEGGREISDADYVAEEEISGASLRNGVFMANLGWREFLGVVHQNLGVQSSQRGDFQGAGRHYRRALRLNPRLPAAYYNLGNDYLAQGRCGPATRSYTRALELDPSDSGALRNRALARR